MSRRSPWARRMEDYSSRVLPARLYEDYRTDPLFRTHIERLAKMDISFQQKIREYKKLFPMFLMTRMEGGSGFRMARILREFFLEYAWRFTQLGPFSFPSSFNVVEGFLYFNEQFQLFDIRSEREHLLRLHDYFDWYTSETRIPEEPRIVIDSIDEGVIYSFEVIGDSGEYAATTDDSKLAIVGVSMVRHGPELSVVLFTGEKPPYPTDSTIVAADQPRYEPIMRTGREEISPHPTLSIQDRYVEGMSGFSKVLLLTRLDLVEKKYDVRYINIDLGKGFIIYSDDRIIVQDLPYEDGKELLKVSREGLMRYRELFSVLASLVFLPVMFVAESERVEETTFTTTLGTSRHKVRRAAKAFGVDAVPRCRTVRCLVSPVADSPETQQDQRVVDPPDLTFESSGFWKPLEPNRVGKDRKGNPIVGRTWVERHDTFTSIDPESFTFDNRPKHIHGPDPGIIYVVRSPSHNHDLYKVGLTRRSTRDRISELSSSTGVPLPFGVLASWNVSNCRTVERVAHDLLNKYRVNKRREFFRVGLETVVMAVERAIETASDSEDHRGE